MASQAFVNQANFENPDMAVRSGPSITVSSADFTRGLQAVVSAGHAKSSSGVQIQQATSQIQQQTIQQQQHTQQVLRTIAPDSFPSNSIKNEGTPTVYIRVARASHICPLFGLFKCHSPTTTDLKNIRHIEITLMALLVINIHA